MIAALDVRYDEDALTGEGAAVVFERWDNAVPLAEYTAAFNGVEPYVSGQFFKRELPCLLAVLEKVREPVDHIIVDGFVSLGNKPGLGLHLWKAEQTGSRDRSRQEPFPIRHAGRSRSRIEQATTLRAAVGIDPRLLRRRSATCTEPTGSHALEASGSADESGGRSDSGLGCEELSFMALPARIRFWTWILCSVALVVFVAIFWGSCEKRFIAWMWGRLLVRTTQFTSTGRKEFEEFRRDVVARQRKNRLGGVSPRISWRDDHYLRIQEEEEEEVPAAEAKQLQQHVESLGTKDENYDTQWLDPQSRERYQAKA